MSAKDLIPFYVQEGLSFFPIPLKSKEPTPGESWKQYQSRRPTEAEIKAWLSNGETNIAVVCGAVSENLVVVDFDDMGKYYEYQALMQEKYNVSELFDYTRAVQTSKGIHLYFKTDSPVKSAKFPNTHIDVQAEGKYVVGAGSIHPDGPEYKLIDSAIPIKHIKDLAEVGIDLNQQKPEEKMATGPDEYADLLKGVSKGSRDDTAIKLIGYFRNRVGEPVCLALMIDWNNRNQPPLPVGVIQEKVNRAYTKFPDRNNGFNNNIIYNDPPLADFNSNSFQNRDKTVTDSFQSSDSGKRQNYSASFDEVLKEAGRMSRRDISLSIGVQHTSDIFRQIVSRRVKEGKVRFYHGSHDTLEWVNREYKVLSLEDYRKQINLNVNLPLNLNHYVKVPAGSVIGVAGFTSAGKTAFLLEIAELNVKGNIPVYYWFHEMSEERMMLRLEDYPELLKEFGNKFKAVKQSDFEFYDVIEPDAINLIDYLDLDGDGDQAVFMIGKVIKQLQKKLGKGVVIYALQKKETGKWGYGGSYSGKLSNLYLALDTVNQDDDWMQGKCTIVKAKDWDGINPVNMVCTYHTGGKHGKILSDNLWTRQKEQLGGG